MWSADHEHCLYKICELLPLVVPPPDPAIASWAVTSFEHFMTTATVVSIKTQMGYGVSFVMWVV